jgi:hypothetical protein
LRFFLNFSEQILDFALISVLSQGPKKYVKNMQKKISNFPELSKKISDFFRFKKSLDFFFLAAVQFFPDFFLEKYFLHKNDIFQLLIWLFLFGDVFF